MQNMSCAQHLKSEPFLQSLNIPAKRGQGMVNTSRKRRELGRGKGVMQLQNQGLRL